MGTFPCHLNRESTSHTSDQSAYLSSQLSLPSVRSLASQSFRQQHHCHQNQPTIILYECISTLTGHSSYVYSLALSGKYIYSGSSDKEIRIWNDEDPINHNKVMAMGNGAVKSIVISGNRLFSAHQDSKIRVWRIENDTDRKYKLLATLPTLSDRVLNILPGKNYVQVRRHKKCTWVHHVDAVSALVLSRDQSLLYSASWDRTFKIWQISDYRCLESVSNAHDDAINAIALSDNGFVYTGSADKKIKVWHKAPGDKKHSLVDTLERHQSGVNTLALSNDGCTLYSGACDRSILVWEKGDSEGRHDGDNGSDSGRKPHMVVVGALRGHTKAILCLALVWELVCSGSADKTVRVWRRGFGRTYSCLAVLEGHKSPVKCITATENYDSTSSIQSYLVYTGSLDCGIKVWQISIPVIT